jgi:PPP family 3-phenylpropionic acid transporter
MLSMVVTGLRMLLLAASKTPSLVLVIQLLNGLTFPTMWVAGVSYADEKASAGMGTTAQGLFSAVVLGFGTAVGGFIGGPLLESIGGQGLYFVFGVAVLAIVTVVALIHRRLPGEEISPDAVID